MSKFTHRSESCAISKDRTESKGITEQMERKIPQWFVAKKTKNMPKCFEDKPGSDSYCVSAEMVNISEGSIIYWEDQKGNIKKYQRSLLKRLLQKMYTVINLTRTFFNFHYIFWKQSRTFWMVVYTKELSLNFP